MQGIKVQLEQTMVNYRVLSTTANFQRSYPLPPYSTVIGMIHNACDWTEYHPMQVAVSGVTSPEIKDFSHINTFVFTDKNTAFKSALTQRSLLPEVNLVLTIIPDDENDLELIEERLLHPTKFLALGRHEDLVRIDSVKKVQVSETTLDEDYESPDDLSYYIPLTTTDKLANADGSDAVNLEGMLSTNDEGYLSGTEYLLTKKYTVEGVNDKSEGTRVFDRVPSLFTSNIVLYEGSKVLIDNERAILFPA